MLEFPKLECAVENVTGNCGRDDGFPNLRELPRFESSGLAQNVEDIVDGDSCAQLICT